MMSNFVKIFFVFSALILAACGVGGEKGEQGPQGKDGTQGPAGEPGNSCSVKTNADGFGSTYTRFGTYALFWSATELEFNTNCAYSLSLDNGHAYLNSFISYYKSNTFSVRCVRD